jgi:hypothetical protein
MKKFFYAFLKEAKGLIPAMLFFFVVFTLVALTDDYMRKAEDVGGYVRFTIILFASLIMSKVVFIADHMRWIHLFQNKPLIYATAWKSLFYVVMSVIVRLLEHLVKLLLHKEGLIDSLEDALSDMNWTRFWVVQAWLLVLFFVFVAWRELSRAIGVQKVRELFFGKKS